MTKQAMATCEGVGQAVTKLGDFFRFSNEKPHHHTVLYRRPAEVY